MSHVWLVKVKKTSLLVIILIVSVALLASCSSSTDEGSKASNKEETSTSGSTVRSEAEDTDSSEQAASSSNSEDQNQGEARVSSEEVVVASSSENRVQRSSESSYNKVQSPPPKYPDPPKQLTYTPPDPADANDKEKLWYLPDVDGDGVGSEMPLYTDWMDEPVNGPFRPGNEPPGWVPYKPLTNNHWDNCPETYNPNQEDSDNDGWGDVCDPEPLIPYNPTQAK